MIAIYLKLFYFFRQCRRTPVPATALALFLGTVLFFSSAHAQNREAPLHPSPSALILLDNRDSYEAGPYIHVSKNPGKVFNFDNYRDFVESHLAGDRANLSKGPILNLGSGSTPYWMILEISNKSWTDKWILSFGQHMDGRYGLADELLVYDHFSKAAYINTLKKNKDFAGRLKGNALSLTIPRGKQTLLFLYIVPTAGIPTTIAPELMTESAYGNRLSNPLSPTNLFNFFFIGMIGICLSAVFFRGLWCGIFFSLYYLVLFFLFRFQNETLQTTFPFASHIPGILFNAGFLPGLLGSRIFCGAGKLHRTQAHLAMAAVAILALSCAGSVFLIPDDSLFQTIFMYGPPVIALLFLFMLTMAQGYTGHTESYFLAAGWMAVFLASLVSVAGFSGFFTTSVVMINAYWFALPFQGALLAGAMTFKFFMEDRAEQTLVEENSKRQETIRGIVAAKEASENARLVRMIEHEREIMNELREREAKQSEEMKKAKDEADLANNAKSAFLAVISHEIRTPMTGIMGMVRLLLGTELNREQKDYAQTLLDSGDAMMSLLNDILDFEKIESGKMDMERIDFDLYRLVSGVKTLMTGHAEAKNIYLKVEIDPTLPRYVIGDPVRIRQVILNLTGNSIKFTNEGGVTIRIQQEASGKNPIDNSASICRIRFSIADTGVGISKEAQKNLFNPFSQADSSVARKFGGTGLGLAISQKLIESMGGRIEIDSAEGRGSTFFFTILVEKGSAEAVEKAETAGAAVTQKPEKALDVLIVEDNEINQKLLKELIERMGHKTGVAGSGEEALKILETRSFQMILMDIQLPGMTGMGTTKALRSLENNQNAATPVIALTGNVRDEDVRQCYAANMNGHLSKPVDPKKLKDMIAKVISGKLDNPVALPEKKKDEHTKTVRLDIGDKKFDPAPPPVLRAVKNDYMADESDKRETSAEDEWPPLQAKRNEDIAPITALAMGKPVAPAVQTPMITLSEDDLDENSFDEAIGLAAENSQKETGSEADIFNHALFENLRESIGHEKLKELFTDMFSQADALIESILSAYTANDADSLFARAHELKGMAGNFGLAQLSALAARIESSAKDGLNGNIQALLTELQPSGERARRASTKFLESRR